VVNIRAENLLDQSEFAASKILQVSTPIISPDPNKPRDARIDDLISRISLREKVIQLMNDALAHSPTECASLQLLERGASWRGHEIYAEAPYLAERTGVGYVTDLQGNDPNYLKVVANVKHFAVYSGPEPGRGKFNVNSNSHDLFAPVSGPCSGGARARPYPRITPLTVFRLRLTTGF
jgi:hypothetical protein